MDDGLSQLGEIKPGAPNGGCHQEIEVLGQEERRERSDDVGEEQNGEEGKQYHIENLGGHQIPDVLHPPEVVEHPIGNAEYRAPKEDRDKAQQKCATDSALLLSEPS